MQKLLVPLALPFTLLLAACGPAIDVEDSPAGESALAVHGSDFDVDLVDCVESIGVDLVPTANARALVPAAFVLAGDGTPVTPIVVRTSRCGGISVDGHAPKEGAVVQVGAVIVPPDFSGDINNYVFWYYTTDGRLADRLEEAGVQAQQVSLNYADDAAAGTLHVEVPKQGHPRLSLAGTVVPSPDPAGSFEAIWWQSGCGGAVRMDTTVPVIDIGTAGLTLTTPASGPLGELLGAATASFPILQQWNTFANATMHVSVAAD